MACAWSRHVGLVAVLAACGVVGSVSPVQAQGAAQAPGPRFRTGVTYVEVDAVVTDAEGRFVPELSVEDFELLEEGKPQRVSAFSIVDLPIRAAAGAAAADAGGHAAETPDTVSNEDITPGRIFVVVLDDLHTQPSRSQRVRDILRRFVERYVTPSDLVAVLSTGPDNRIVLDFTSSHAELLAATNRFLGRRPSWMAPADGLVTGCFT
jgi:VWFA-related protein